MQFQKTFSRVRDVAGFVGLACVVGTTLNAVFIAVAECYTEREWDQLFITTMNWWVANAMACLIVTPAIIAWGTKSNIEWSLDQDN